MVKPLSVPGAPPAPAVRAAQLLVTDARHALERGEQAWNRGQLLDALNSARRFIAKAEQLLAPAEAENPYAHLDESQLREALAEADRRAGAAEREKEQYRESNIARSDWLWRAKREAGYDSNVSFDIVWAETLAKARLADSGG